MNPSYTGFAKKLWINKTSLLIDSIEYTINTFTIKVTYQYFDKLEYLNDFNKLNNAIKERCILKDY
jgi:hypothetical protein